MKYGKRWTLKRVIKSPLALTFALVLFIVLSRAAWNIHQKAENSQKRLAETASELTELESRQRELSEKVSYLSTAEGLEAEIRTKYHAVRQGEQVAVIIDDQEAAAGLASTTQSRGFWRRIFGIFGF